MKQFKQKRLPGVVAALLSIVASGSVLAADYTFKFQSSDPAGNPNFILQKSFVEAVKEKSDGKIEVVLLPVGAVVDYKETQEAVEAGILDGHITDTSYFAGKDPAFGLIANPVGAWSDPAELIDFIENGGGKELMNALNNPYGLQFIGVSTPGLEAFVSKVPLDKVADLKGLKVRNPEGLIANVFAAAGAAPVNLPASEVYTSLDKGVIDAADYSVFSVNQEVGMNKVAPHPVYPGFHSLPLIEVSMNKKKWDELPADLQTAMEEAVKVFQQNQINTLKERDLVAIELAKEQGITIHDWPADERAKFRGIAMGEWEKLAGKSEMSKTVYDTLTSYLKEKGLIK